MGLVVLVCEASPGIGRLSANAIAQGGHTIYAALRRPSEGRTREAASVRAYARRNGVDLRPIVVDLSSDRDIRRAVCAILAKEGRIDVLVHNSACSSFGPTEAFTAEQLASDFDRTVVTPQRIIRAALPSMRARGGGLMVWIGASGCAGGLPPFLGPSIAAKAALDVVAVQYAMDLVPWGIETTIVVPGLFDRSLADPATTLPADEFCAACYDDGPVAGNSRHIRRALGALIPAAADAARVAGAVAAAVDAPAGERPFRVHVDPVGDGASVAYGVVDRLRSEMLVRMGLHECLSARSG